MQSNQWIVCGVYAYIIVSESQSIMILSDAPHLFEFINTSLRRCHDNPIKTYYCLMQVML